MYFKKDNKTEQHGTNKLYNTLKYTDDKFT